MKQCQRQIGQMYKQFTQPSYHAEIVAELLEPPSSVSQENHSSIGESCYAPLSPDTTMSDESNPHDSDLATKRTHYNEIRKRKRLRIISDDEISGVGEEIELDPALFIQKEKTLSVSPREYKSIRQRKKVKFAGQRKEQEFHEYMPTYSVVRAALSKQVKDTKDPHVPRNRPYVPDGEEIPEFIYSDDSDDLMKSLKGVIHETRSPSTDKIEIDENYAGSGSYDADSDYSDDSGIFGEDMEGISPLRITRIEGVEPPKDNLDVLGEPGPAIESNDGNLKIEDVLKEPTPKWIVECPACGKRLSRNQLNIHLDSGCEGLFEAIVPNDDTFDELSEIQSFDETVSCPLCQKFVILEKINEHIDTKCKRFLAEDNLSKSSIGGPSAPIKIKIKNPRSILKEASKGPHISFAGDTEVKMPRHGPLTSLPRWMLEDPPLKPLTKIVETQDTTKTNSDLNKPSTSFKGNVVPIGHSANAEEQDQTKGSNNKGKDVIRSSIQQGDEALKSRSGNIQTEEKEASMTEASREDMDKNVEADDEMERGRSKLRGGNANRKRSAVRSRSHGKRRRQRSLTNHY